MSARRPDPHPLVARYLDELDRLLVGIHPSERAEVVEGVREHLELSLGDTCGSDAAVRSALDELGPAVDVAEAAYDGRTAGPVLVRPRVVPVTSRAWLPPVATVLQLLALMSVFVQVFVSPAAIEPDVGQGGGAGEFAWFAMVAAAPFWVLAVILALVSELWTLIEKVWWVAIVPAAVLGLSTIWWVPLMSAFPLASVIVGLGVPGFMLTVLARTASRRSSALASRAVGASHRAG